MFRSILAILGLLIIIVTSIEAALTPLKMLEVAMTHNLADRPTKRRYGAGLRR
jgi:hypothetical protein